MREISLQSAAVIGVEQPEISAPPAEVVLPSPYYSVLLLELIALCLFYHRYPALATSSSGRAVGWIGASSMILMHVYSLRRRVRTFFGWGRLSTWLHFHIFMGLQGALLVSFHSLHVKTVSNLSGITLLFTWIVVCSGILGRYIYAAIPKTLAGQRMTSPEIEAEIRALSSRLAGALPQTALDDFLPSVRAAVHAGDRASFGQLIREDLRTRLGLRRARRQIGMLAARAGDEIAADQLNAALLRRVALGRRLLFLHAVERLFRHWTLVHRPLTYILAGMMTMHIFVHYLYGPAS